MKPFRTRFRCSTPIHGSATGTLAKNIRTPLSTTPNSNTVIGAVHTQTIEGFWSIIKRGIVGSYHKVSRKYLPLDVAKFQFRYNNWKNSDIFGAANRGNRYRRNCA